jgi:hypothetical protein
LITLYYAIDAISFSLDDTTIHITITLAIDFTPMPSSHCLAITPEPPQAPPAFHAFH